MRSFFHRPVLLVACAVLAGLSGRAVAQQEVMEVIINRGAESAISVAVVPFGWQGTGQPPVDIAQVVAGDLTRSGKFSPLTRADLPNTPTSDSTVDFNRWRPRTSYLVVGNMVPSATPDTYQIQFRLYDVLKPDAERGLAGTQLLGLNFQRRGNQLRATAHDIADQIYEAITGIPGAFNSRIAYITETTDNKRQKRYTLKIADSDGFNAYPVLESVQPIMSPTWAPDGARLAYVSFEERRARIFIQDLASGQRQEIAAFPGINGAPSFSPDGTRLAMTLSKDGNAEVYVLHLRTRDLRRITNNPAIDTEPEWTPDGRGLVFTSNRGGNSQIYFVSANGGKARRLTFDGAYNAGASFSPDGKQLAVVHRGEGSGYQIGLFDLERGRVEVLTNTRRDDSPSFSPNGAMVLYSTTDIDGPTLTAVTVVGRFSQSFALRAGIVRDPAWGPIR
jgi:TolB protein